jgi:hypothetical protein
VRELAHAVTDEVRAVANKTGDALKSGADKLKKLVH